MSRKRIISRLSLKLNGFVVTTLLLGIGAITIVSLAINSNLEEKAHSNLISGGGIVMENVDKLLNESLNEIITIAHIYPSTADIIQDDDDDTESIIDHMSEVGTWRSIAIYDNDQEIVSSTGERPQYSVNTIFDEAGSGGTYYSDVTNIDSSPYIVIAVPIIDPIQDNQKIGIVVGELSWTPIVELIEQSNISGIRLLNQHGETIAISDPNELFDDTSEKDTYKDTIAQAGYLQYRGNNWTLEVIEDKSTYAKTTKDTVVNIIMINILTFLAITLVLYFYINKSVIVPINALSDASNRVTQGEFVGDIPINSNDEIGELARSFNAMIHTLQNSQRNLEALIEERTKKLQESLNQLESLNEGLVGRELKMIELKKELAEYKSPNHAKKVEDSVLDIQSSTDRNTDNDVKDQPVLTEKKKTTKKATKTTSKIAKKTIKNTTTKKKK